MPYESATTTPEHGLVVSVADRAAGSELVGAHALGVTELVVVDAYPFSEVGGELLAPDESVLSYTGFDDDTSTIFLTAPTTAAYDDGELVLASPLSTEKTAVVMLGDSDDSIDVRVPHHLDVLLVEGTRESDRQESISLAFDGDEWVIVDVIGRIPEPDAGYLVGTVPDATLADTQLQADLDATAAAVADAELEIAGILPITETKIADDAITTPKIAALAVTAGEIAAGAITASKIDAGAVTAAKIAADAIDGKTITGALIQSDAGATDGVKLDTDGFTAFGLAGDLVDSFRIGDVEDIAYDGSTYIYCADVREGDGYLRKFRVSTGREDTSSGFPALIPSVFGAPTYVTLDASGNVYTTSDSGTTRKFSSSGVQQTTGGWPISGGGVPKAGIAVDSSGSVYLLDQTAKLVRKFSSAGVAGITWSTVGTPAAIKVHGSVIYVTDTTNSVVRTWSLTGTGAASFTTTDPPYGLYVDPVSGDIYVGTESGGTKYIRRFTSAGSPTSSVLSDASTARGLAVDSSGRYLTAVYGTLEIYTPTAGATTVQVSSSNGLLAATQLQVSAGLESDVIITQSIASPSGIGLAIQDLITPVLSTDAANKEYVDAGGAVTGPAAITSTAPFVSNATVTRIGQVVYLSGDFSRAVGFSASFTNAGTVPDGYRPDVDTLLPASVFVGGSGASYQIFVFTTGVVQIRMSAADTRAMGVSGATWVAA